MKVQYTIKEGNHRSGIYFAPYIDIDFLHSIVNFNPGCIYNFDDVDQYDINKLTGLSFGLHHCNSVRYGWRAVGNQIELSAYMYEKRIRIIQPIGLIDTDQDYNIKLMIYNNRYQFKVYKNQTLLYNENIPTSKKLSIGYQLFPYFGGNRTAPHVMHISLQQLKGRSFTDV